MTETARWEAWIDATAPVLGLGIAAEWRPGVVRFLALAAEMAALVEGADLPDDHLELDATLRLPEAAP